MKRLKILCSAIAAFSMLALAGCDLEIADGDKPDYLLTEIEATSLPITYNEKLLYGTTVNPMGDLINSSTGLSVSFVYKLATSVSDNTYEWETPIKLSDSSALNIIYIDFGPLGVWLEAGGANKFEGDATAGGGVGSDNGSGNDAWRTFCQNENAHCMTVNFNADGSIVYYKDGVEALNFPSTLACGTTTVGAGCAYAIKNAKEVGITLHATNTQGKKYTMSNLNVSKALTDTEVSSLSASLLAAYNAAN